MSARRHVRALAAVAGAASLAPLAVAPLNGYLALLTFVAGRTPADARRAHRTTAPTSRVAVVIPAHDEEALVADTVASVRACGYPSDLLTVHVVADHCTDGTADAAHHAGALVLRHDDPEPRGKSAALRWAIDHLGAQPQPPEIVVILDADSVVDPGFLTEIDQRVRAGATAVQAFYAVRDAQASAQTSLREVALALRHYVRPLGRTRLGGSCGLFGNGMAFDLDVLRDRPWSDHLTEDLELQLRLLLEEDVTVVFAPAAVVRAQMPEQLEGARTQNERWERGRIELLRAYGPRLARAAGRASGRRRWRLADAALDLAVPPLSVLAAATAATSAVAGGALALRPGRVTAAGVALALGSCGGLAFHVVAGLRTAGVGTPSWPTIVAAPRLVVWKVGVWTSVLRRGREVPWTRTARTSMGSPERAGSPVDGASLSGR